MKLNNVLDCKDEPTKEVLYFGHKLTVPVWAKYIATHFNGWVYVYDKEPSVNHGCWYFNGGTFEINFLLIASCSLNGVKWEETLLKLDDSAFSSETDSEKTVTFDNKSNEEKRKSFSDAAKPLMKWLSENASPHHSALVCISSATLVSDEMHVITDEFVDLDKFIPSEETFDEVKKRTGDENGTR